MAIRELLEFIGKQNIAEDIDDETLATLGARVKRQFDEDWSSMKDWMEGVDQGMKLMKQEFHPKSTPWDGASNFKSPLLSEASIAFGDKASLEILRARNLVKADIIGRDNTGKKKELAERITEAMNYQVNYQMDDWREEQKRLLYTMPNAGCMFKKTVFDPLEGETVSHIIQYPDFAINQATKSMKKNRSFTQILDIDQNGVMQRQIAGIWLDEDLYPEEAEGDEGSNEANETINAEENPDRFLEQQCYADLDDDGLEEPYIVTIHERTMKVVRVIPRYNELSFVIKTKEGRVLNLVEFLKQKTIQDVESNAVSPRALPESEDINGLELVRIQPNQQITKYGFIPSPDGTFLDLGYAHLLGAITQAVNTTTNQLTDAGTISNVGGGFLAKGFRKKMGPVRFKPGEYKSTDIAAKDLQTGILPNPTQEPSQTLFALNEKLEGQGRSFAAIVDAAGQITANTAPTTALAIIQEALISTSALMGRVIDSMSKEFQILFALNKRTFDPELYKMILDDPEAQALSDFNNESLDIVPTASPEMSSKLQRIQLATVEMEQIDRVVQAGGNPTPIVKNFYERIGSDNVDEIFPEEPTTQQEAEMKRFTEAQEQENAIAQSQLELNQLQTEILGREQERLDTETEIKVQKTLGELEKMHTEAILNLEKAESEDVKNQINVYTARLESTISMLTAIGADDVRRTDIRDKVSARQESNLSGSVQ